jgi:quercetin dioxygenase-like cupin family protein
MNVRLVVTGVVDGEDRFVSDDRIDGRCPPLIGNEIIRVWGFDEAPTTPISGEPLPSTAPFYPPPGGLHTAIWTLPPAATDDSEGEPMSDEEQAEARRLTDEIVPGMLDVEFAADGSHTTATVDIQYILSGRAKIKTGGVTKEVSAGDVVIVNGGDHAWWNDSDETCVLYGVFFGLREPA